MALAWEIPCPPDSTLLSLDSTVCSLAAILASQEGPPSPSTSCGPHLHLQSEPFCQLSRCTVLMFLRNGWHWSHSSIAYCLINCHWSQHVEWRQPTRFAPWLTNASDCQAVSGAQKRQSDPVPLLLSWPSPGPQLDSKTSKGRRVQLGCLAGAERMAH